MSQDTLEITNLESLLGDLDHQEGLFSEPMEGIDVTGGMVMTTSPCATTFVRISVATKC